jgi:HK97 family phage prohead protease
VTDTNKPPRENLVRALGATPELVRAEGDMGMPTLRGHFAVWDTWTEIRSAYEGHFMERFSPTAMTKTLSERGKQIKVLFQHGKDPQIGDKPLGVPSKVEPDERGAYYEVPLFDTSYNRDLIPALDAGAYGASFRFQVVTEDFNKTPSRSDGNPHGIPERTVTEAKVIEFGPVTFPAYANATAGLRSMTDEFMFGRFLDDPERLRELLDREREFRREPRVTVTYGKNLAENTPALSPSQDTEPVVTPEPERLEPELSEATTPTAEVVEPEPSVATTREPGATPSKPRFNTREEWLQWICRT